MDKIKAYNEVWLKNLAWQSVAKRWHAKQLMNDEQLDALKNTFPQNFYHPNVFLQIALFIFSLLGCCFVSALVTLMLSPLASGSFHWMGFFTSLISSCIFLFSLSDIINNRKAYNSGMDIALIYSTVGSICGMFISFFSSSSTINIESLGYCLIALPVFMWASLRYAEMLIGVATYCLLLTIVALIAFKFPLGKALLPFIVMFFSATAYWLTNRFGRDEHFFYYHALLETLTTLSLVIFYLGGNYLIVREGNAMLNEVPSQQIAFAPLFYFFTVMIPVLFVYFGLKNHSRKHLLVGFVAVAFSIFTYRTYNSIMPLEWALALGGFGLILLSVLAIRYLKTPKFGISYEEEATNENLNFESIIVTQVINIQPQNGSDNLQFGGGDTGGGGSDTTY